MADKGKISGTAARLQQRTEAQKAIRAQRSGNDDRPHADQGTGVELLVKEGAKQAIEKAELRASEAELRATEAEDRARRTQAVVDKLLADGRAISEAEIDPQQIVPSRHYNRTRRSLHPDHPKMKALIAQIEATGGNVQRALCVPAREPGKFEIVFGERRASACRQLGIPLRAFIAEDLSEGEILEYRIAENAGHVNPSVWATARQVHAYLGLMQDGDRVDSFLERFSFSRQHRWRLERIASLPEQLEAAHPDIDEVSQRDLMMMADAFAKDPEAFAKRIDQEQLAELTPKEATDRVLNRSAAVQRPPATLKVSRKGVRIEVRCERDIAEKVAEEVRQVLARHGIQ